MYLIINHCNWMGAGVPGCPGGEQLPNEGELAG